jgi:hypothetical protein
VISNRKGDGGKETGRGQGRSQDRDQESIKRQRQVVDITLAESFARVPIEMIATPLKIGHRQQSVPTSLLVNDGMVNVCS